MNVKYVDWGLANWYKDHIEINNNLKKYTKLHDYVLRHELCHNDNFDLFNDFKINLKYDFLLILFCARYPKTLIDLSPVWIKDNSIIYDSNKIIMYILALFLFVVIKFLY